ncbi:phage portal protein (plasmid) [Bacillus cytotoxicus]|uniref:HK97 family phage portal protein n=2 Tax=Bacillus cytotoxicus TaxID=580165 RepID=A0AAX2CK99_9BACI|nr:MULTISPECIES: phage portal protein [Bacillus cereus group]MDH2882495.1 phage portal protein [Bacillus cytotoxicus]QTR81175.1 phage portal protein [Bacillus cytotoxicus]QTR87949.1 phage portal protein [Bacillus cytotoxicus]SCM00449.1 HK97 family phage portal protein [Bacillus cytotoxicus]HDR4573357.1 phage portal protein [Bacillus cytotoxicus]
MTIGWLDNVLNRNKEIAFMFDVDMFIDSANRVHMKRLAIETCISFLGRTISQSEFRIKNGKEFVKDELYYRLNVRPNKNMTASSFWEKLIYKLIYDNECLIIQADDGDLLIADNFDHNEYAVFEDTFSNVTVKDYQFKRSFKQSEVIHLKYRNNRLSPLIDGLFSDYGDLFGRILNSQKRKNQIRGTVDMDMIGAKTQEQLEKLQEFINNVYKAVDKNDFAIVPQQKGIEYKEVYNGSANGPSVEEVNKVTNGFLNQVAMAIGIPTALIYGDMADVEKQTKNYMLFTVKPLLKKIADEANMKFFEKNEYLAGQKVEIKPVSYQSIFDLATSIDKLISSSAFTGNEIRLEVGYEASEDSNLDKHYITKNYAEMTAVEGGEKTNDGEN